LDTALREQSLLIEAPELVAEPAALRRTDGASVFTQHGAARYTSQAVLDAEARLLEAALTPTTVGVAGPTVTAILDTIDASGEQPLDAGQRALVSAFASDGRLIVAGIGPAGSGKTTAMKALAQVMRSSGEGRLVPLATSAAAAAVLGGDVGG